MRNALSLSLGAAVLAISSLAGAQDINVSTSAAQPSTTTSTGGSVTDTSGPTDHSVVVGHLALRYFGATRAASLAGGGGMMGPQPTGSLDLHTVGIRYWLNGSLGIEAGLSFGLRSGGTRETDSAARTDAPSDDPNAFGFGLRVALPIQIAEAKHISIQISPYLGIAYAGGGLQYSTQPNTATANDFLRNTTLSFFRLEVGATAQAELQFGFLGAPQLGLIAQFGLGLGYQTRTVTTDILLSRQQTANTQTSSRSNFDLGTTLGSYSLADIISGSLSAVWYFGGSPSR